VKSGREGHSSYPESKVGGTRGDRSGCRSRKERLMKEGDGNLWGGLRPGTR